MLGPLPLLASAQLPTEPDPEGSDPEVSALQRAPSPLRLRLPLRLFFPSPSPLRLSPSPLLLLLFFSSPQPLFFSSSSPLHSPSSSPLRLSPSPLLPLSFSSPSPKRPGAATGDSARDEIGDSSSPRRRLLCSPTTVKSTDPPWPLASSPSPTSGRLPFTGSNRPIGATGHPRDGLKPPSPPRYFSPFRLHRAVPDAPRPRLGSPPPVPSISPGSGLRRLLRHRPLAVTTSDLTRAGAGFPPKRPGVPPVPAGRSRANALCRLPSADPVPGSSFVSGITTTIAGRRSSGETCLHPLRSAVEWSGGFLLSHCTNVKAVGGVLLRTDLKAKNHPVCRLLPFGQIFGKILGYLEFLNTYLKADSQFIADF